MLAAAFAKAAPALSFVPSRAKRLRPDTHSARADEPPAPAADDDKDKDDDKDASESAAAAPATAVPASRKRRRAEADAARAEDPERVARTVFVGNVALSVTKPVLRRMLQAFVDAQRQHQAGGAVVAVAPALAPAHSHEAAAPAVAVAAAAPAPEAAAAAGDIESLRFRSIPIERVAVAPEGSYKHMIKAAVTQGQLAPSVKGSLNAYAVFRTAAAAQLCLGLNGALLEGRHLRLDSTRGRGGAAAAGQDEGGRLDHKRTVFVGNLPFGADEDELRAFFDGFGWAGAGGEARAAVESVRIVRDKVTHKGKGIAFVLFTDRTHVVEALGLGERAVLRGRALRVQRCSADGQPGGAGAKCGRAPAPAFVGHRAQSNVVAKPKLPRGMPTLRGHHSRGGSRGARRGGSAAGRDGAGGRGGRSSFAGRGGRG